MPTRRPDKSSHIRETLPENPPGMCYQLGLDEQGRAFIITGKPVPMGTPILDLRKPAGGNDG